MKKRMKKRIGIFWAMVILIGIPFVAKAAEDESSGTDEKAVKSYGTIIYEDKDGSVRIYAEDIALLQEKLASIPDEIFDPVLYSHIHVWEYIDVTDQGHTKHCNICGSKYDVTNAHSEASAKECTITYDGHDYSGYEKTCECGYTWVEESDHTLVCLPKDATYHTQSCALDGTPYCIGMEKDDLLHMIMLYPTDQMHHQKRCSECGYQGDIEECVFEFEEETTDIEGEEINPVSEVAGDGDAEVRKYCLCGNYIIEPKTDVTVSEALMQIEVGTEDELQPESGDTGEKTEISNVSVSGNDCMAESGMQDKTDEMIEKEGENNL